MNIHQNNKQQKKVKGEILFLLTIFVLTYFYYQFTKKEEIIEIVTNQIDINMKHKTFKLNNSDRGKVVYYASIDNGKINIHKKSIAGLRNKYCLKIKSKSFIKGLQKNIKVHSMDPIIVECKSTQNKELLKKLVSDTWVYSLSLFNRVVGKGNGYFILSNKELVEIKTGNIISDNALYNYYNKSNKKRLFESFNKATNFSGNLFFIYNDFKSINSPELNTIYFINNKSIKTKLVNLPQVKGIPRSEIYMEEMLVSKDGKYLYLLAAIQRRGGQQNLRFMVVDIVSKSIIFVKTLVENREFTEVSFQEFNEEIAIMFTVRSSKIELYTFKNHIKPI